jgi:hypothetical protein
MAENPFVSDSKLKQLLEDVDTLESNDAFMKWRKSFLQVYESYLEPDGILNAQDSNDRLIKKLESLAKTSLKVKPLCANGNICQEQVTAEGHRALGNMTEEMRHVEVAVGEFVPKTSKNADEVGYDKFELGAVLIKNGFHAYDIMLSTKDFITELRDGPLDGVLDKNALSIMDFYVRGIQSFVDVMADLGLWKLMKQVVQIYKDGPRPEPMPEPEQEEGPKDQSGEEIISDHGRGLDEPSSRISSDAGQGKKGTKSTVDVSGARSKKAPKEEEEVEPGVTEEEEEPPPPEDGDGVESEMIIHFDPKTNSIVKL